jgi:Transposase and inactivated derivatives
VVLIGIEKITEEESNTMADEYRMALLELLRKAGMDGDADFLREGVKVMGQALMELEVSQHIGAERHERTPDRTGQRNGYRDRSWDTRVGSIELKVPRVRDGSFYPVMLDPRKRAERALVAVVQEAYVQGVSTRRVDDLVQALGMNGISKSQVSRLCQELDGEVERFRTRRLEGAYPYVWLDATYLKVRENSRVVSMAVVIAIGVRATGEREILGLDVGPSEDGAFWTAFLRGLLARKLSGVKLVVSDAHEGLKAAISAVMAGAAWQRCRVHFMRNALALVPKAAAQMVAATIRTVFVQPDAASAHEQWRRVADSFRTRYPRLSLLLDDAEADVLAYLAFPREHWRQIWSNNPLERLNREIKRRTDVVGIFPNQGAVIRLVGSVLAEQHDEWQVSRRYLSAESLAKLYEETELEMLPALLAAR